MYIHTCTYIWMCVCVCVFLFVLLFTIRAVGSHNTGWARQKKHTLGARRTHSHCALIISEWEQICIHACTSALLYFDPKANASFQTRLANIRNKWAGKCGYSKSRNFLIPEILNETYFRSPLCRTDFWRNTVGSFAGVDYILCMCVHIHLRFNHHWVKTCINIHMIDWCCFYYFARNSLVALLEALCAWVYICVCVCVCVCAYTYVHLCKHKYVCIYIYIYVYIYTYVYIYMYVCVYIL